MTRELLKERLAELERQRADAITRAQAVDGAMQECEHWLARLDQSEEQPSTTTEGGEQ
jgi:hypothetical protein